MLAEVPETEKSRDTMPTFARLLALTVALAASPGFAQGVPPNPFASNYPSAPPSVAERAGQARATQARRRAPPRGAGQGLIPPASIPGR